MMVDLSFHLCARHHAQSLSAQHLAAGYITQETCKSIRFSGLTRGPQRTAVQGARERWQKHRGACSHRRGPRDAAREAVRALPGARWIIENR